MERRILYTFIVSVVLLLGNNLFAATGNSNELVNTEVDILKMYADTLKAKNDTFDISYSKELDGVTVTAQTVKQDGAKTSMLITKSMRRGCSNMGQLLGNLNNFHYNRALRTLDYNNSSNYIILIDSIEKPGFNILDMYHLRFDRIEVIDKPQGKYQGYDVLINLHTKRDYEGYEGSLYQNIGLCFSEYNGKTYIFNNENAYFTYTKNKWTFYSSVTSYFGQGSYNKWEGYYYPLSGMRNEIVTNVDGSMNHVFYERINKVYGSVDCQITKNQSLSVVYQYSVDGHNTHNDNTVVRTYEQQNKTLQLNQYVRDYSRNAEHNVAVFYRNNEGKVRFDTDFNYRNMSSNKRDLTEETTGLSLDNYFRDKMNYTRFRLSGWTTFFNDKLQISAGYENTWKDYTRSDYYTHDKLNSNSYLRNKLWTTIGYRFSKSFNVNLGGWAEHVRLKSEDVKEAQIPAGGNFMAYYQLTKKNWMRLTYDCAVDYPDQGLSSEYGYFTDSLTWNGGNPLLKTNIVHKISFWIDLWRCFNFQTGYVYSPNRFATIGEIREGNLPGGAHGQYAAFISQNTKYNEWWASVSFTKRFCRDFLYKADLKYRVIHSSYSMYKNNSCGFEGSTSINYYNEKLKLNVNFAYSYYRNPYVSPQSKSKSNIEYPVLSLEKSFFKERLYLTLNYAMMFHLFNGDQTQETKSPAKESYTLDKIFDRQKQRIMLAITYRFNGGKSVRKYNKEIATEK